MIKSVDREPIQCTYTLEILSTAIHNTTGSYGWQEPFTFAKEIMWHDQINFCLATTNVCQNVVYQKKVHLALMRFLLRCAMLEVNFATSLRSNKSENCKTII